MDLKDLIMSGPFSDVSAKKRKFEAELPNIDGKQDDTPTKKKKVSFSS